MAHADALRLLVVIQQQHALQLGLDQGAANVGNAPTMLAASCAP